MSNPIQPVGPAVPFGYVPETGPNAAEVAGNLANLALNVASTVSGGGIGGIGGLGEAAAYAQLMQQQNRIQQETLVYSAQSNASKAQHDTKKTIVNNWRGG